MKRILFLFIPLIHSCSSVPPGVKPDKSDSIVMVGQKRIGVSDVDYHPKVYKDSTPYHGDIKASVSWNDVKGRNFLILCERPQYFWEDENPEIGKLVDDKDENPEVAELFAWHYVYAPKVNKWKPLWTLNDFIFGCCDVEIEFLPTTLRISDLDSNGVAESIFTYNSTASDGPLSNSWYGKQILHIDSVKYSLVGDIGTGDDPDLDPEYSENHKQLDPAFHKYCSDHWERSIVVRDSLFHLFMNTISH